MAESAKITFGEKSLDLPVTRGTEDEIGLDISALRATLGAVTVDNGLANTSPADSSITFLDGEKGILRYRGYSIEELAGKARFVEVVHLLLHGELPTAAELASLESDLAREAALPAGMGALVDALPKDGHPMALLAASVSALSGFYGGADDRSRWAFDRDTLRLLAQMPTIAAAIYRLQAGLPRVAPDPSLGYVGRFLKSMFARPDAPYEVDPVIAKALGVLFILHADHEFNCSTSTVRIVGSSQANLYASVAAGIGALWGPLHGGANQKVLEMLETIRDDGGDVDKYVALAKDRNSGFRLMGFGHRVYKNFDPRARIIKGQCDRVLDKLGIDDPLLDIAKSLEQHALSDEYFVERKLYPNVDFYSGIIYRALGIPTAMFTVMFALGRLPGWISHWREMNAGGTRIARPRQIYTGPKLRAFVPVEDR